MTPEPSSQTVVPSGPLTEIGLTAVPSIPRLFATLIGLSFVRSSRLAPDAALENVRMTFKNRLLDPDLVQGFKAVCGYPEQGPPEVPAPYIQTLFIGVISRYISSPYFPITPMGLIQVGQSFTQFRPVSLSDALDLSCTLLDMTQTPKGITTRFAMEARGRGEVVWQGIASYFTRAKNPPPKAAKERQEDLPLPVQETIRVPADTGRRYAAVSRDYNPHHLYPWTARLIGFKRAIAHGIWSLARTGASLEKAFGYPDRFEMDGVLKLPIFLPSTITLGYEKKENHGPFELRDEAGIRPHLKGVFTC